jgi:rubredoxin
VVLIVGSGSPAKPNASLKYGHFASLRWQHGDRQLPEVLISGEGLKRSPAEILVTLLHEATHGLADVRGVQDTSRQGRWHNKKFATLAAELGLEAEKDDRLGYSPCTLTDQAAADYGDVITGLAEQLGIYRHPETFGPGKERTNNNNGVSCECECPRKIRLSVAAFEEGPIVCSVCEAAFLPEDIDRDNYTFPTFGQPCTHGDDQADDLPADREDPEDSMRFYDPTGERYGGTPTYPFRMAPTNLATRRQLREQGLRPGGQEIAAQILWRRGDRVAYLYRIDQAKPKREATPAQRAAISKALAARRTCPKCGDVKDYYISTRNQMCGDCLTGGAA